MMNWEVFWTLTLIVTVCAFAALAIVVTIGAAFDARKMLRELKDDRANSDES